MNTRHLSCHYEINKHYLNQDLKNAIALIVDNISLLSDEQIEDIKSAIDLAAHNKWANRCDE